MDDKKNTYRNVERHLSALSQEYVLLVMHFVWANNVDQDITDSLNRLGREIMTLEKKFNELKDGTAEEESKKCTYLKNNGVEPTCTHECDGCEWYT